MTIVMISVIVVLIMRHMDTIVMMITIMDIMIQEDTSITIYFLPITIDTPIMTDTIT